MLGHQPHVFLLILRITKSIINDNLKSVPRVEIILWETIPPIHVVTRKVIIYLTTWSSIPGLHI